MLSITARRNKETDEEEWDLKIHPDKLQMVHLLLYSRRHIRNYNMEENKLKKENWFTLKQCSKITNINVIIYFNCVFELSSEHIH